MVKYDKQVNIVLISALLVSPEVFSQDVKRKKPNVIVIVSDDAGYQDFGCYGGKQIPTPNINSIARDGVRFTDAYVTASVSAPSRAGLLTGRYQQRFGFEHNMSGAPAPGFTQMDLGMEPGEKTIADELQAQGYRTLAIGKWHLGDQPKHHPLKRGFNEFFGFIGGDRSFFSYEKNRQDEKALENNGHIVPEKQVSYLTDMFTERAISFIKENKSNPFFIYLAYNAVHVPMHGKKDIQNRFSFIKDDGRRAYAAMMWSLDEGVGGILKTLKEQKIDENTLVVFINDNGGATGNSSDNGIFRGMKGSKWEGGIRVALLMKWPGKIDAGLSYTMPVSSLDILPTALAASGSGQTGTKQLDGVNLFPYLKKENNDRPHASLFWRRGAAAAVRMNNWKLIRSKSNPDLLFDLRTDPSETKNLALKYPEVVRRLRANLTKWEEELPSPHWLSAYGDENQIRKHRLEVIGRDQERLYP